MMDNKYTEIKKERDFKHLNNNKKEKDFLIQMNFKEISSQTTKKLKEGLRKLQSMMHTLQQMF